jgi:hypothetical protein
MTTRLKSITLKFRHQATTSVDILDVPAGQHCYNAAEVKENQLDQYVPHSNATERSTAQP